MDKGRLRNEVTPVQLAMLAATVDPWKAGVDPAGAISLAVALLEAARIELEGSDAQTQEKKSTGGAESPEQRRGVMTSESMKSALYG